MLVPLEFRHIGKVMNGKLNATSEKWDGVPLSGLHLATMDLLLISTPYTQCNFALLQSFPIEKRRAAWTR